MKIGFKREDVIKGGQYENLYYDYIITPAIKRIRAGEYYMTEPIESDLTYTWLSGNKANIKWEDLGIFVELPVSFKTTPAPAWLTKNTYLDENGDTQTHTLESYGKVREDSIDTLNFVMKVSVHEDLTLSQLDSLDAFLASNPTATGLTINETRTLLNGPNYTI